MTEDLPSRIPDTAPERTAMIGGIPVTVAALLAIAMILLALIGAGATLANVSWAEKYWLWLVPAFGIICTVAAWMRTGRLDSTVLRQVLHWLAVGVTIAIDFSFFRRTGEQTTITTSLNSLLFLALGCLLAGIHLEWSFALVGLLLLATAFVVAIAQEYMALVFVTGAILIALLLIGHRVVKRWTA
ncbi:hypothetical protein [Pseudorhodoplanes sp.]|uniref:hypothetical protein n=1 Tax=Pseudorhodoplanes sp. TaxID=1934341 RepID=UPI002BA4B6C5|nr:hypothetical protein [Pseudorhodoplanes sp.]HWV53083.1 hypothetical protein [Pseudorhodoplanes sp.]